MQKLWIRTTVVAVTESPLKNETLLSVQPLQSSTGHESLQNFKGQVRGNFSRDCTVVNAV